jgi:hypothetical protein
MGKLDGKSLLLQVALMVLVSLLLNDSSPKVQNMSLSLDDVSKHPTKL